MIFMNNQELRDNYKSLLHESYKFTDKERECICDVIDCLENVHGRTNTENELAEKCKVAYNILKEKGPFKEFVQILKAEKKVGDFNSTTYYR